MNLTTKEKAQAIINKYNAVPEKQISTGNFLNKVGRKYVTILNIWEGVTLIKQTIDEFYFEHF